MCTSLLAALMTAAPVVSDGGPPGNGAVLLDGVDDYVVMGPDGLGGDAFTLEAWFRIDGPGVGTQTGTGAYGGAHAYPIISKGWGVVIDNGPTAMNFFLGVESSTFRLLVDFEDMPTVFNGGGGANHTLTGKSIVTTGVWHHAAATYDGELCEGECDGDDGCPGGTWRLYLDGRLEAERRVALRPRFDSVQPFAVGTAIRDGAPPEHSGFFRGAIDEVRLWDHARTGAELRAEMNEVVTASGLLGHWTFDEVVDGTTPDASPGGHDGTVVGGTLVAGGPLDQPPPAEPAALVHPELDEHLQATTVDLTVTAASQSAAETTVRFWGRQLPPRPDAFTIAVLPDTQRYLCCGINDAGPFRQQTEWIACQARAHNIRCVVHVGDIVQHGWDGGGDCMNPEGEYPHEWTQWQLAKDALSVLDDTELPYLLAVGNHDDDNGDTTFFNDCFPVEDYMTRPWYGGHFGDDYDNHYLTFTVGGQDYLVLTVEFDAHLVDGLLEWADGVLQAHPDHKAILVSHELLTVRLPVVFSQSRGAPIFDALKHNPNLFVTLCGHVIGEGRRTDVVGGNEIHSMIANYQQRNCGGHGWMRLIELAPGDDIVRVKTYSPMLDRYERDPDSEFTMGGGGAWMLLGTVNGVPAGAEAQLAWASLEPGSTYEWYAETDDGTSAVDSPVGRFHVLVPESPGSGDVTNDGIVDLLDLIAVIFAWGPCAGSCPADLDCDGTVGSLDLVEVLVNWT